tara:strand:- start:52 stop:951 length:900 start_codon:yes stop_codon:yes gene_type:complete
MTDNGRGRNYPKGREINSDDLSFKSYLDEVNNYKPLSREREGELSSIIQGYENGSARENAIEELVNANLRFVINVAKEKQYRNRSVSLIDLIAAGNVGLLTAANRFDGTKGYKFISYAVWWIRQNILYTLAQDGRTVRLPVNAIGQIKNISKASQILQERTNREPTIEEIAKEADMIKADVEQRLLEGRNIVSLDENYHDYTTDEEYTLAHRVASKEPSPEEIYERDEMIEQIKTVVDTLDEREEKIIRLYYGLDGKDKLTLDDIGKMIGVTRERVRQLKERALQRLRHPKHHLERFKG